MEINQMPNCCGVYLITNFGHTVTNGADHANSYKPTVEDVKEFLNFNCSDDSGKMYIVFINNEQRTAIGKALKDTGFKRKISFYHADHDSIIHQYIKIDDNIRKFKGDF